MSDLNKYLPCTIFVIYVHNILFVVAVIVECMTVWFQSLHCLQTYLIVSDRSINFRVGFTAQLHACDMRHIIILLLPFGPFLLHDLLADEVTVQEYNEENPFDPISDPSDECIGIVNLFLTWYNLFCRCFPPKDELDIEDLRVLSLRYAHLTHFAYYYHR